MCEQENKKEILPEVIKECIKRLSILHLNDYVIDALKEGTVFESAEGFWSPKPIFDAEKLFRIAEIEKEYNIKIYYLLENTVGGIGKMEAYLFVENFNDGQDEDRTRKNWEKECKNLENDESIAFVNNLTEPCFSEFGLIGIEKKYGGLIRKW